MIGPAQQAIFPFGTSGIMYHPLCAADRLLRRLEKQYHVVDQAPAMIMQPLRKGQQIGHVAVVTAGVHAAFMRGSKAATRLLAHRQRVDIRAERYDTPLPVSPEHGAQARAGEHAQIIRRKPAQLLHQIGLRLVLGLSDFGNAVQGASVRAQLVKIAPHFYVKLSSVHTVCSIP